VEEPRRQSSPKPSALDAHSSEISPLRYRNSGASTPVVHDLDSEGASVACDLPITSIRMSDDDTNSCAILKSSAAMPDISIAAESKRKWTGDKRNDRCPKFDESRAPR
jgi:hypothetical protein